MPNIVGPETVDSPSTDGVCTFPAAALGGSPYVSPTVYLEKQAAEIYISSEIPLPAQVTGTPLPTNPLAICQPGVRSITPVINTSVRINGLLFAVTGDQADLITGITTPRTLTGPFSYPTIQIGTQTTTGA